MLLKFIGGAKTVTGSCYLLELENTRVLIDCGMFQGTKELRDLNYAEFPFDPRGIDFLLLTHAHIDHSGLIPRLHDKGFKGKIVASSATIDLCRIMLPDSGHIQELEAEWHKRKGRRAGEDPFEPLYTAMDAEKALSHFTSVNNDEVEELNSEVAVRFREAGHILGSSIIEVWIDRKAGGPKLVFSGDLGNVNQPIIRDPEFVADAGILVIESTYGNRIHEDRLQKVDTLRRVINDTFARGGNVIIPAFAIGRTQDVLYELALLLEEGSIPSLKVYIDSPLAVAATEIFKQHSDCYDVETRELLAMGHDPFSFPGLTFVQTTEESRALNEIRSGAVIVSASGMCEFGRIKHHLKHNLWRPESTILFVGFQAKGTLGRRLQDGQKRVRIFNEEIVVRAEIESIDAFSAHADKETLLYWVRSFRKFPDSIFVVHGEEEAAGEFASTLKRTLGIHTYVPGRGDTFDLRTGELTPRPEAVEPAGKERAQLAGNLEEFEQILSSLQSYVQEITSESDRGSLLAANDRIQKIVQALKNVPR